ncbi:phosphohistidine phosphatase SixA [bacterium]
MKLLIVRHADSISSPTIDEKILSEKGIQETVKIAKHLQKIAYKSDNIWHSTKLRAKQTASIIAEHIDSTDKLVQKPNLAPLDDPRDIITEIENIDENVIVVSHLPFIQKMLSYLFINTDLLSIFDFKSSSVICLEKHESEWVIEWALSAEIV